MSQNPITFPLKGGLDLVTRAVEMPPGRVIAALNYVPTSSGYRRIRGYERFDGNYPPSAASIAKISFTSGNTTTQAMVPGAYLSMTSQLQYAFLVAAPVLTGGSYAGGTATGYFLVQIGHDNGTYFVNGATLKDISAVTVGTQSGALDTDPDLTGFTEATLLGLARGYLRAAIGVVPGSGPVRAIFYQKSLNVMCAIRDNVGATAGALYRTQDGVSTQWSLANLPMIASFNLGGIDGQSLVEGQDYDNVSGVGGSTATCYRFVVTSGSWAGGNAAGYIYSPTTSWLNADYLYHHTTNTALRVCRLTSAPTLTTLPAGGSYEVIRHNFYGASDLERAYLVNGVGKALEYGGNTIAEIRTGMTIDTPTHIGVHKNALFLAFPGGSLQFSSPGEPLSFDPIIGAGEIGVGSDITALVSANATTLAILAEVSISALYGNDSTDFQLETLTREAGALAHSAQKIGKVVYMDNGGIRTLNASSIYGNFNFGALSILVQPLIEDLLRDGVLPVASLVLRRRDQYWLFFDNGDALVVYMGGKTPEIMPVDLGFTVTCAATVEIEGVERAFVGTSTGYVMELEKGTSFDGAVIEHYFRLPFSNFGSAQVEKRAHKILLDCEISTAMTLSVTIEYDYGSVPGLDAQVLATTVGGAAVDNLGSNELYYNSQIETVAQAYISGVAKNFSAKFSGSTSTEEAHTVTAVTYLLSARGLKR